MGENPYLPVSWKHDVWDEGYAACAAECDDAKYVALVRLCRDIAHPEAGSPYAGPDARTKLATALAALEVDRA